jgi:1-acyl-sn-glycerol-3-phosphate acyltransferase
MVLIRSLVFNACFYAIMGVLGIVCAPLALWSRGGAIWTLQTYCKIVLWLLRVTCGLRTEVRGTVPDGDVLVCSKHQSFLDILMLVRALPRPRFIMKKELRWAPVLGFYAMRMGSTPVERGKKLQAMKDMVEHVERGTSDSGQLVIYPQGTRVAPDARLPYKIGAGVLYSRMGKTCVPAATNVGVFWGRNSLYRRPGLAVLEFLDPLPPGLPVAEFMTRLEAAVETRSDELMREAGFDPGPPRFDERAAARRARRADRPVS